MADFNKPFISPANAVAPYLSAREISWMNAANAIQKICITLCVCTLFSFGTYAWWIMRQPYWDVDVTKLEGASARLRETSMTRDAYLELVTHLNQRIRFDLVAQPLLLPEGDAVHLESLEFHTQPVGQKICGRISATAISTHPDVEAAKVWLRRLGGRLKQAFPNREVQIVFMESSVDQRTGNLRFLFTGEIQ